MTFKELKDELNDCYFAQDIKDWWDFRADELQKLPFHQYKELLDHARLQIECEYMGA
jgi:hypothetical protein